MFWYLAYIYFNRINFWNSLFNYLLLIQLFPPLSIISPLFSLCQLNSSNVYCIPLFFIPWLFLHSFLLNTVPMILIVPTEFLCMIAVSTFWFKYYKLHTTKWLFICLNIHVLYKPLCLNTYCNQKILLWGFNIYMGLQKYAPANASFTSLLLWINNTTFISK